MRFSLIIFLAVTVAFPLFLTTIDGGKITGETQNTNNTKLIVNVKNHTISVVDTRTNETISTRNFATTPEKMTTNSTLSGIEGNMTANSTLPGILGNASTSKVNLTEKFSSLGK